MAAMALLAAEAASREAKSAASDRASLEEQLGAERGRLAAEASRLGVELETERRRVSELQAERTARDAELPRLRSEAEERRRGVAADSAESEKRQAAEVARLRAAMVDLERHLESRARTEMQLKKKIQELWFEISWSTTGTSVPITPSWTGNEMFVSVMPSRRTRCSQVSSILP